MSQLSEYCLCYNGVEIPCIGMGTYRLPNDNTTVDLILSAIKSGYLHLDTALKYGNEEAVGAAVKTCGKLRSELFVTTKLWNNAHGYEETKIAFEKSIKNLGLDYLDLYLIHWPNPLDFRDCWQQKIADTWRALEELYELGKVRAIGVCNFMPHHLDSLMLTAKKMPMVNQFNVSPGRQLIEVVDYCKNRGIVIEATKPFARGKLFEAPEIIALSNKYQKTPAQLCIRWSLQNGFIPLPKSSSLLRLQENANVFDFQIDEADIKSMSNLSDYVGDYEDPDTVQF